MGRIVGSALVSHQPGLMQSEDMRRLMGAGTDSDLIAGYARLRERIEAAKPDLILIFDTHWFSTGYHLIDGGEGYQGTYLSDEMPWYLYGVPYKYRGDPEFALGVEAMSKKMGGYNRAVLNPDLARHYPTINLIKHLRLEISDIPVVSSSICQNCRPEHFLKSGEIIGEAIRQGEQNVIILASGALSHRMTDIDWKPNHPSVFHESNVSSPEAAASDKRAIELMKQGCHDQILDGWETDFMPHFWEAWGGHYLQMLGALGGTDCRAEGVPLSAYENARGTGNIHIWFDEQGAA
ncbi:extradiol ring-cleavage dioxygenase [Minwuia sp.]|uniref:DODA-type extradiol aromatic ring-opening family dioxygenase n=1 Tax=Minwuia sp. TaxID=2493630 RepID=UPI003A8D0452